VLTSVFVMTDVVGPRVVHGSFRIDTGIAACDCSTLRAVPLTDLDRELSATIGRLAPASVLVLEFEATQRRLARSFGDGAVSMTLGADGLAQAPRQYDVVVIDLPEPLDPGRTRAALHTAIQHVAPGAALVIVHDAPLPERCGLDAPDFDHASCGAGRVSVTTLHRGRRTTVHDLVFRARSTIERVEAIELARRLASDRPPLVVDTRTDTDRFRFGVIAPSIHVPYSVAEWHLDPANSYLHPAIESFDQPLVVICNGGYSSSLTAGNLVTIGFTDVADLIGGFAAWDSVGLPIAEADHSHLGW
jgi:rhodanese-related sulfurtransferase